MMPTVTAPLWVADQAGLGKAAADWQASESLFIDTEFIRETTFHSVPALIQVSDGRQVWLVDPVPIRDWTALGEVLASERILKVFHACQEDVELLARLAGVVPRQVMDTQLAASFVGLGWSIGYRRLVEALCSVLLDDSPHITRSNWLARPLSEGQFEYAVSDVVYLARAWPLLRERLQARACLEACLQESAARVSQILAQVPAEAMWKDIGGIERLSPRERCILRRLCLWREGTARRDDVSRNRLLRDSTLLELARSRPRQLAQLAHVQDLRPGVVRRHGQAILDCITAGLADDETVAHIPEPVSVPLMKSLMPLLKARVVAVASAMDLPETLLASRNMLVGLVTAWVRGEPLPAWMNGWRAPQLGAALIECLEQYRADNPVL